MNFAMPAARSASAVKTGNSISLTTVGVMLTVLLLTNGLAFRTYTGFMAEPAQENFRIIGLYFVICELAIIVLAFSRGFRLAPIWQSMSILTRTMLAIFFATFWVGGSFVSPMLPLAPLLNLITIIHIVFAGAIYHCAGNVEQGDLRKMAVWLSAGMAAFVPLIAYMFLNHPPLESMPDGKITWQLIIPGFISIRLFGAYCGALFTFLLFATLLDEEKSRARLWQYAAITLFAGLVIWSATRAAVLAIGVISLIAFFAYNVRPQARVIAKLAGCLIVAAFAATYLIPYNSPDFMLYVPDDYRSFSSSTGGRFEIWSSLWQAYLDYPWFGAGPAASVWLMPEHIYPHIQPHNFILQFFLSWGLIATTAALTLLATAIWHVHRIGRKNRAVLPILLMLDASLVMALFDGMLFFARDTMLILICFGLIFASAKQSGTVTSPEANL